MTHRRSWFGRCLTWQLPPFKTRNDEFRKTSGRPAVFRFGLTSCLKCRIERKLAAVRCRSVAILLRPKVGDEEPPGTLGRIAPPVSDALHHLRRIVGSQELESVGV